MTTEIAAIRDQLLALVDGIKDARGIATVRKTPVLQVDEQDLPIVSVFIGDDNAEADEDATAGPPHFVHQTTYHLTVLRNFATGDTLDGLVDDDMDAIQNAVLRDPTFNAMIEGVLSMRRSRSFPTGEKGTVFAEMRFEMTVQVRTTWQPIIPDELEGIDAVSLPVGAEDNTDPLHLSFDVETSA